MGEEGPETDTEILLSLLAEVDEQIAISRGCVHDANSKFEEGKEFEAAAAERAKEAQLSEATRKKLARRALTITTEVKGDFAKATAQLRHAAHHYKHARAEIERALRHRDRKVFEYSRSEGRAEALSQANDDAKQQIEDAVRAKNDAEVRARSLQADLEKTQQLKESAEEHNERLLAAISESEAAMQRQEEESERLNGEASERKKQLEAADTLCSELKAELAQANKAKEMLTKQLQASKEVVARVTADNLMLLNKVQHTEAKMEQAVREREVLRVDLNTNDNRWFDHLRDEIQKVTLKHLETVDMYEARMTQMKGEASEAEEEGRAREDAIRRSLEESNGDNDTLRQDLSVTRRQLAALQESHEALVERNGQMSAETGGLRADKASLEERTSRLDHEVAHLGAALRDVQARLQDATRSLLETGKERDVERESAQSLGDELDKQRDQKERILREKQDVERRLYEAQAAGELAAKKHKAMEQELQAAKQEKDIISRQLASWATSGIPGSLNTSGVVA